MQLVTAIAIVGLAGCSSAEGVPRALPSAQPSTSTRAATVEPFSLLTHCGISTTQFAGRDWVAVTPLPEPRLRDDVTGLVDYDGYTAGTMTLVEDDLLRFTVTDPTVGDTGLTVHFVPTTAPPTSWCD